MTKTSMFETWEKNEMGAVAIRMIKKNYMIPKESSKMDNPEKLATLGTRRRQTQQNICWTSLYTSKHK